ncbi:hypothetical protein F5B20DRAFT_140752 [Whalleya microplaca]|nr:hypothetical protein F5B20DRAFT_140752 [Whalleya microplaca]
MGFTTGFTGGFTLTLSVAYLTVLAHQRHREHQAAILRQQTYLLHELVDPLPPVLPPTRAELAARERASLVESAKDRWNAELEGAVRWAQTKDWDEVREGVETAVSRLWARASGKTPEEIAKAEAEAEAELDRRLAQSRAAAATANEKSAGVAAAARSAYADAKARGAEAATKTEEKAEDAKGGILSAIGKGFEKGKEAVGKAKSAVGLAEQKVESQLDPNLSPVERALNERYQQSHALDRSADEILASRYAPHDQKDNTQLKAL